MRSVSITKIADQLGLSPSTVSRALNDKYGVNHKTRQKVLQLAAELGYVPSEMARELVTGRSHLVGIVLPEVPPEYRPPLFELVPDMNRTLEQFGFETIIRFFNADAYEPGQLERFCLRRHVEGVLILPGFGPDHMIYVDAVKSDVPSVILSEDIVGSHCSSIGTDEAAGMQLAISHLHKFGHKHIGFINGFETATLCKHRLSGYLEACEKLGLPSKQQYVIHSDFSAPGGSQAAWELTARFPEITAICFANDMMALGAISKFQHHHVSVPNDLSIVGYDNIYPIRYINPPLTSIEHNHAMGIRCAELLHELMQGASGTKELLRPRLVERSTVAVPPTGGFD